jgi:hypothetical protein
LLINETHGGKVEWNENILKIGRCHRYKPYEIFPMNTDRLFEKSLFSKSRLSCIRKRIIIIDKIPASALGLKSPNVLWEVIPIRKMEISAKAASTAGISNFSNPFHRNTAVRQPIKIDSLKMAPTIPRLRLWLNILNELFSPKNIMSTIRISMILLRLLFPRNRNKKIGHKR